MHYHPTSQIGKLSVLAAVIGLLLVTGCGGKQPAPIQMKEISMAPARHSQTVRFPGHIIADDSGETVDRNDPEQMVNKAIALSESGKHAYSAEYLLAVSELKTPDNNLKIRALFAAANAYLMNGEVDKFQTTMEKVDPLLDAFARSNLSSEESVLVALFDISQGRQYRQGIHPMCTQPLFQSNNQ